METDKADYTCFPSNTYRLQQKNMAGRGYYHEDEISSSEDIKMFTETANLICMSTTMKFGHVRGSKGLQL